MSAPGPATPRDAPDVVVHPPVLFAGALVAGAVLNRLWPLWFTHMHWPWRDSWPGGQFVIMKAVGWVALALGFYYAGAAIVKFRRAGTGIPTFQAATALVTDGIYRFTRNPMYVGGVLMLAGLALLLSNAWLLLMLFPVIAVLRWGVIAREEIYMEAKFGDAYRDYKSRVRRRF